MELILVIIFSFAGIIGAILVYQYVAEKMGLDIKPQQKQQQPAPVDPHLLYRFYKLDYENFGSIFFELLKSTARLYGFRCPYDATGTYAARIADRVRVSGNCIRFCYEIHFEPDYSGMNKPANSDNSIATQIAQVVEQDLPEYLVGGYFFIGRVRGWQVNATTIRIEIYGIGRQIMNDGDLMI